MKTNITIDDLNVIMKEKGTKLNPAQKLAITKIAFELKPTIKIKALLESAEEEYREWAKTDSYRKNISSMEIIYE